MTKSSTIIFILGFALLLNLEKKVNMNFTLIKKKTGSCKNKIFFLVVDTSRNRFNDIKWINNVYVQINPI